LLIDDEPILLELGEKMLQRLGYSVQTCLDGLEALSLLKRSPKVFDLVISDMTMPRMTGDRLAIAMLEIRPDLPIVLCTGFSSRLTEKEAAEIGVKALVFKPLVMETLALLVRDVLDGTRNSAKTVPFLAG
jgi:DNA-binding NtrC family response regulator